MSLATRTWARIDGLENHEVERLARPALRRAGVLDGAWLSLDAEAGWALCAGALTVDAARALSFGVGGAVVEISPHARGVVLQLFLSGDPFDDVLLVEGAHDEPVPFELRGVAGAWRVALPEGRSPEALERAWRAPGRSARERLLDVAKALGVPPEFAALAPLPGARPTVVIAPGQEEGAGGTL